MKVKVQPDPTPLLSFRALGGDPSLMHAITRFQPVEGYCDQIVQMVLEVENVGHVSISQLRFCTNQLEQSQKISEGIINNKLEGFSFN